MRDAVQGRTPFRAKDLEGESELYEFPQLNAYDRFDLVGLNSFNLARILEEADRRDRGLVHQVRHVAMSLLDRVRQETGDREEVTQLLRELACHWFLESPRPPARPGEPAWKEWATEAWAGLFYESRVTGGWRKPRLADRLLWASKGRSEPDAALRERLFGRSPAREEAETLQGRPHEEVLQLRVAQAILDDLAGSPRNGVTLVPLAHLDDLASSVSVREVNSTLQSLFHSYDDASFLLLDPNRNPEVGLCTIRWPSERREGAPSTYQLVVGSPTPEPAPSTGGGVPARPGTSPAADLADWVQLGRPRTDWIDLLTRALSDHARLPAPPSATCRQMPGYRSLRAALLQGPPLNDLFAKTQWKGRPTDLTLLNQLVATGALSPEVETDGDYLEAELNDLVTGDPRTGGEGGTWPLGGDRVVRRTFGGDGARRYAISP
ncbi:MAG TPA: hypothetical protein VMH90_00370, partial [Thermoplasmata archaeon]|nr:hypothetical protein [Thermoplasmata archaeon]